MSGNQKMGVVGSTGSNGESRDHSAISGGGGGGGAGAGGGFFSLDFTGAPSLSHTTATVNSAGHLGFCDPNEERLKELESQVETLKKELNEKANIEYFRSNVMRSLVLPYAMRDLTVGPDDCLVMHVDTEHVPPNRAETFLRKIKNDMRPLWERMGIQDRVMVISGDKTGISVIHSTSGPEYQKAIKKMAAYAAENRYWNGEKVLTKKDVAEARKILRAQKRKRNVPLMG